MGPNNINIIRSKINEKGHSWSAGATSISKLPPETMMMYLGLVMPEAELKRIRATTIAEKTRSNSRASVYPPVGTGEMFQARIGLQRLRIKTDAAHVLPSRQLE